MKAVLLFGSPHENGFTAILADEYLSSLSDEYELERFDAYCLNASSCTGCGACAHADICMNDDLEQLFDSICGCDLLVIASPVYYLTFPAPLKAIVDRMQRFHEADRRQDNRMKLKPKRCAVLLTAGSPSERGEVISRQLRWITGSLGVTQTDMIVCADTDRADAAKFRKLAAEAVSRHC